jgi:hypothetical protein
MALLKFKQKEAKTVQFTCTSNGVAVDLSTATLTFMIKGSKSETDAQARVSKADAAFGKGSAASGIVTLALSATDLTQASGKYLGELKAYFSAASIAKSADIDVVIEGAVIAA